MKKKNYFQGFCRWKKIRRIESFRPESCYYYWIKYRNWKGNSTWISKEGCICRYGM